jgi:hypothetical protein
MEIYLLSVALARHRMITVRPRRIGSPTSVPEVPEPNRDIRDTPGVSTECQPFSQPLQRNSR